MAGCPGAVDGAREPRCVERAAVKPDIDPIIAGCARLKRLVREAGAASRRDGRSTKGHMLRLLHEREAAPAGTVVQLRPRKAP